MTTWRVKPIPESERRNKYDKWQLLKSGKRTNRFANKRAAKSVMRGKAKSGDEMVIEKIRNRGVERLTKE